MTKSILFAGPMLPPIHGQSLAFTYLYESITTKKYLVDTNSEGNHVFGKLGRTIKAIIAIIYVLMTKNIDTVYFTCSRSFLGSIKDIILINLAKHRKIKIINHLHGSDFYDFIHTAHSIHKKLLFLSYNKVDISIVLFDSMKEQFKDFKNMDIRVVPNFYLPELSNTHLINPSKTTSLLYLSNIIKSKGIFELISAFKIISQKYPNIQLHIAGAFLSDEYMSASKIKKLFFQEIKDQPNITYHGIVSGDHKSVLFQSSDIFILPSYFKSEAFPLAIIEAMYSRNAIITTNYKYLPELVSSKCGLLVDIQSIDSLTLAIETLLNDDIQLENMKEYNYHLVNAKYTLSNYLESLHKILFEEIL